MTTQTQIECPICMDVIDINKNSVTTECGHCFHSNCLMTSVAHNGFACPYCRASMAVVPNKKEDDDDDDDDENWTITSEEDEEMFLDYTLRGLRFFFNNLNGDEHDENDIEDEDENAEEEVLDEEIKPSCELITEKLIEQGVTVEYLIKALLSFHTEYENDDIYRRVCGEIYGKVRVIISNYIPPEQPVVVEEVVIPVVEEVVIHYPVVRHRHQVVVADVTGKV
jgi:hypothetical protein